MPADPYAHLKDDAWRELAEIDGRLERGEIDEAGCHEQVAALAVPAYVAAAYVAAAIEPYGLEIAPELADLARRRLLAWAHRIASWEVAGRSARRNPREHGMEYRALWIHAQ